MPKATKQLYATRRAAICLCKLHPDAEGTLAAALEWHGSLEGSVNMLSCGCMVTDLGVLVQSHFSKWIEAEVEPEDLEDLYKEVSLATLPDMPAQ